MRPVLLWDGRGLWRRWSCSANWPLTGSGEEEDNNNNKEEEEQRRRRRRRWRRRRTRRTTTTSTTTNNNEKKKKLVSWCFKPCQPQRTTSGLKKKKKNKNKKKKNKQKKNNNNKEEKEKNKKNEEEEEPEEKKNKNEIETNNKRCRRYRKRALLWTAYPLGHRRSSRAAPATEQKGGMVMALWRGVKGFQKKREDNLELDLLSSRAIEHESSALAPRLFASYHRRGGVVVVGGGGREQEWVGWGGTDTVVHCHRNSTWDEKRLPFHRKKGLGVRRGGGMQTSAGNGVGMLGGGGGECGGILLQQLRGRGGVLMWPNESHVDDSYAIIFAD